MPGPARKCKAIRRESQSSEESQGSTSSGPSHPLAKRRKLKNESVTATSIDTSKSTPSTSDLQILDLPIELLENILRCLPFEHIGKIRIVSRGFNEVCSSILNSEFQKVRTLMQQRFQTIKRQMPRRESARRKHKLAQESDIVETMHMRLTLLHMTFGKHIERKHCCFFAGEILDEVYRIINYIKITPNISRAYKVTDELFDLSTMAMEYFKDRIEPTLPEITYITTDFFDYTPTFSLSNTPLSVNCLDEYPATSSACVTLTKGSPMPTPYNSDNATSGFSQLPVPAPVAIAPAVRRRLRNLRDSVRKNDNQITSLKKDLKITQRRMFNQQRQINELKAHHEDYDKKFQNTSRKLNAVLQELSRCKTELQYWRSKSPANSSCICGKITPINDSKDFTENPDYGINIEPDDALDDELEKAFSEEFKPIHLKEEFEIKPGCSSSISHLSAPPLVVPAKPVCSSSISRQLAPPSLVPPKPGCSSSTSHQVAPPLVVPAACHGKVASAALTFESGVAGCTKSIQPSSNKPFTRATKRNLENMSSDIPGSGLQSKVKLAEISSLI